MEENRDSPHFRSVVNSKNGGCPYFPGDKKQPNYEVTLRFFFLTGFNKDLP